jgi:uncharacterized protein (DUF362 family)
METVSEDQIRPLVDELLSTHRAQLTGASSVVVLPTAHYPYHPTTGQVTNPAVTEAVALSLSESVDPDRLVVGIGGSAWADAETLPRYLGYTERFRGTGIDVVSLDGHGGPDGNGTGGTAVPALLEENVVVNVPTLRRSTRLRMVAGMASLAWAVRAEPESDVVTTVAESVRPAVSILDGTYVFDGVPSKSKFLLGSADPVALDQVCATILGLDSEAVAYLPESTAPVHSMLEGVRMESLRADVHSRKVDAGRESERLLATGYRLYSRLSGDALPPQFVGDVDG